MPGWKYQVNIEIGPRISHHRVLRRVRRQLEGSAILRIVRFATNNVGESPVMGGKVGIQVPVCREGWVEPS